MRFIYAYFLLIFISTSAFSQEVKVPHDPVYGLKENKGQWNDQVLFQAAFQGGNFWVQQHKLLFHFQDFSSIRRNHGNLKASKHDTLIPQSVLHLNFLNSNKVVSIEKSGQSKPYYNYFMGKDPSKWASGVHAYEEVSLKEIYPAIDLKVHATAKQSKYEFRLKPNANPNLIQLDFAGYESIQILKNGDLQVVTKAGTLIEKKPFVYQIENGKIKEIESAFKLSNGIISFQLGKYNTALELVIDPILVFATYSGSITDNFGMTATYGYDKTAYSGGTIYGNAYPTPDNNAYDVNSNFTVANNAVYGITDVFISKYTPDGTAMIWTSFIGGGDGNGGTETVHSLICDQQNNIYFFGATSSLDFPIVNGFQTAHAGGVANQNFYYNGVYYTVNGTDLYVAKLSSNGYNLLGSTYLGGSKNDGVNTKITSGTYNSFAAYDSLTKNYGDTFRGEIMLDENLNVLVASSSRSTNFPTLNPIQAALAGQQDGVVVKLDNNLSNLLWSTYYGGTNNDACYSVKVDSAQHIVFAGGTSSNNIPFTAGGWQPNYNGGKADGFVIRYNPSANAVVAGTYVGTSNYDQAFFVEIDRTNSIFLVGHAEGGTFPITNAAYSVPNSSQFIVKFPPTLNTLTRSTLFGNGTSVVNISPAAFLVDICGNIYVSGWGANILQGTLLSGMPITANAFQSSPPNGYDFYLIVIERDFNGLLYGSYLGGASAQEHVDGGTSRFDKNGIVYQSVCGGCGGFSDFPTSTGAWSNSNLSSNCNNILFKFDFDLIPKAEFTPDQTLGCATFTVSFNNTSSASDAYLWDFGNGDTTSVIFNPIQVYDTPGVYDVFLYVTDSICLLTDTAQITITVTDSLQLDAGIDLSLCTPIPLTFSGNSFGTASQFIWSSNINFTDTLNANLSDSMLTITPNGSTTYYLQGSNAGCSKIDSVQVHFISSSILIQGDSTLCLGDSTLLNAVNTSGLNFVYDWQPNTYINGDATLSSIYFTPPTSQYVYLTASNAATGCVVQDSMWVTVSNLSSINVIATASEYAVAQGTVVTLFGEPTGYSYQWTPTQGVQNPIAQNTDVPVNQTTIYTLTVTDGICDKSDTVLVKAFQFICGDPFVYIPNAFTPNGDQENDVLYVRGTLIKNMVFRIFDRWGEMVFESYDRLQGWDGTFRGKKLDPDVYDYYLEVTCIDEQTNIIKGNITLMK